MISKSNQHINTADQLLAMPSDGNRYELLKGVLHIMAPAGSEHGKIAGRIFLRLASHVEQLDLGETYAAETGFKIATSPDTVRAPDAAFVSRGRLATVEPTRGFLPLAPDLVVEVVSPNDSFSEVESKAEEWLGAGSKVVLVADPVNLTVHVFRTANEIIVLRSGDTFSAGDVCGDWQLSIDDAFQIAK